MSTWVAPLTTMLGLGQTMQAGIAMLLACVSGLPGVLGLMLQYVTTLPPRRALRWILALTALAFVCLCVGRLGSWFTSRLHRERSRTEHACKFDQRCAWLASNDPMVRYSSGTNADCEQAAMDCAASPWERTWNALFDTGWHHVTSTGEKAYDTIGWTSIILLGITLVWNALAQPRQAAGHRVVTLRTKNLAGYYGMPMAGEPVLVDSDDTLL